MNLLERLWTEEEGQDLTEYALLLVLLALAATATLNTLATAIKGVFSNAALNLKKAVTLAPDSKSGKDANDALKHLTVGF